AWWQVDLETAEEVARVVVVCYYADSRYYGFLVEGSLDDQNWTVLTDERNNTRPSTIEGYECRFEPQPVRYLRVTQTHNSANIGRHLVEVTAFGKE
ncbi:MAG: discoidin domain-containing protein, partial [Planctomycetaceae bacterium]|nr:discoidin domain-containing protein [Planctomycetaceae bacterium]